MSKKGLRTCCVCRTKHSFCPSCNPEDREKPTWYFAYCGKNCKDIYEVTSEYENGRLSANNAKEQLDKLDLSKIENFGQSYQNAILKINENYKPVETVAETKEIMKSAIESNKEDKNEYFKKPKYKRAKNDNE